tara:strand:- start:54 stop:674 length:621 start_codon:yes stop_codon:yes gene_type:complete
MQIIKPFGPSIVKLKIPEEIIVGLNDYVDQVVKSETKSKELDYGSKLAGNVKQEILLEESLQKKVGWGNFLASSVQKWINFEKKKNITEFKIINSWIVRQFKNEYNPTHFHDGHISGVGYLKVPKNFGEYSQDSKSLNRNGKLDLIHGSKMFLCNSNYIVTPEVGDMYLFPNYLMHSVYPFTGTEEERRSVSFNAFIDKNVANPYI